MARLNTHTHRSSIPTSQYFFSCSVALLSILIAQNMMDWIARGSPCQEYSVVLLFYLFFTFLNGGVRPVYGLGAGLIAYRDNLRQGYYRYYYYY